MQNELTFEMTIEKNMTWSDVIKHFKPDATDDFCEYYLWNETCYPFSAEVTFTQIKKQLSNP